MKYEAIVIEKIRGEVNAYTLYINDFSISKRCIYRYKLLMISQANTILHFLNY